jgi:hypothetical protein
MPALLDQQRELDNGAVDPGLRGHHEHVLRTRRGQLVEPVRDLRITLELLVVENLRPCPAEHHEVVYGDRVRRDQSPGAAGEVHRHRLRVPGPERVEYAAATQ